MEWMVADFLQIDLPAMLVATLAAIPCALLGSFVILQRRALLSDSLSHAILPGIVGGFLLTGSITPWPMMLGALVAALLAVVMIEWIGYIARVESGAAMGVVFTLMFAAGVVMLEQLVGSRVHLDVQHALYGSLETVVWLEADSWNALARADTWNQLPSAIKTLLVVNLAVMVGLILLFKELKLTSFDPGFAASVGIPPGSLTMGLVALMALVAVAAFKVTGSILVVAMFICPAATARVLTNSLTSQLSLSVGFAVLTSVTGYVAAAWLPLWLGGKHSLSAAGMIAVVAGLCQIVAMLSQRTVTSPRTPEVSRGSVR